MTLNEAAMVYADALVANSQRWRCSVTSVSGARVVDCGGAVTGGLQAGLQLARVCTAGLADIFLVSGADGPEVQVSSDDPVRACLAAQYAGWQIKTANYFAMGSGPMRAAVGREALFNDIPGREQPDRRYMRDR
jgi:methenyltetrahydromethanopterin cyclohydrolase